MTRRIVGALGTLMFNGAGHLAIGRTRAALAWLFLEAALWGLVIFAALGVHPMLIEIAIAVILLARVVSAVLVLRASDSDATHPSAGAVTLMWFAMLAVGLFQAMTLRLHVLEAFKVPAGSMIPTLQIGDHMFVDKRVKEPHRGDVVVFVYPKDPDKDFVKRVIAVAGDTIEMHDRIITLNGEEIPTHVLQEPCTYRDYDEIRDGWQTRSCVAVEETLGGRTFKVVYGDGGDGVGPAWTGPFKVPEGTFFVMGDNRDNSHDSRFFGAVPFDHLKGKALLVWLGFDEHGLRRERMGVPIR